MEESPVLRNARPIAGKEVRTMTYAGAGVPGMSQQPQGQAAPGGQSGPPGSASGMKLVPIQRDPTADEPINYGKKKKSKRGLFGKKKAKAGAAKSISGPTNFAHESHVGWNALNGFQMRDIPPEWKQLLKGAGVKKSELKNRETCMFIVNTVAEAVTATGAALPAGAPSLSGPTGGGGAPPPPPPAPAAGPPPPRPPQAPLHAQRAAAPAGRRLQSQIAGAQLKKAEERTVDITRLDKRTTGNLANTLAMAMSARRMNISAGDEDEDDGWSSDEWSE